jgi:hypothetical protein
MGYVLLYEDRFEADTNRPSFSDVADVVRDLRDGVIDSLDPVNLRGAGRVPPPDDCQPAERYGNRETLCSEIS